MGELFPNQNYGRVIYKHINLPLYQTDEFNFFRCISFNKSFYGKTVSVLHAGNLREGTAENRYALLFGNRKLSYWADSLQTARAEIKYHNPGNNLISFWAYDDATSTFPMLDNNEKLIIVDSREIGFSDITWNTRVAEIGYWVKKSERGQGVISAVLPEIEKFGFEELGFRKLVITSDVENKASRAVAEKFNYVQEGILRAEGVWPNGSVRDKIRYSKLKINSCCTRKWFILRNGWNLHCSNI